MSFNKASCATLRAALAVALKPLEDKFDCKFNASTSRMTFSDDEIRFKFVASANVAPDENGVVVSSEQDIWNKNCMRFGLKPEHFGKQVSLNGTRYRITGIKPSARKNCVKISGPSGGTWITNAQTVIKQL